MSVPASNPSPVHVYFDPNALKPGDIIGFSGEGLIGDLINIGTWGIPRWNICHVGIVGEALDGRQLLFESTTLDDLPCEITGVKFDGTQAHDLDTVVKRYRGRVWRYPLYRTLYEFERRRLTDFLMGTIHVPYSKMEALHAADFMGLSLFESMLGETHLHHLFCSGWVARS